MARSQEYEPSSIAEVREDVDAYLASGGTDGIFQRKGMPTVLVSTVGARSGKLRRTPLMRVEHDGEYAIVASSYGADTHPAWYHNVKADPHVQLQDGTVCGDYLAREVTGAEKAAWWDRAVTVYPPYADYQAGTDRVIPVFVLTPAR